MLQFVLNQLCRNYVEAVKTPLKCHIVDNIYHQLYVQDMTLMFRLFGKSQSCIVFDKASVVVNIYVSVTFFLLTFC